jgi:hypothetical protein
VLSLPLSLLLVHPPHQYLSLTPSPSFSSLAFPSFLSVILLNTAVLPSSQSSSGEVVMRRMEEKKEGER